VHRTRASAGLLPAIDAGWFSNDDGCLALRVPGHTEAVGVLSGKLPQGQPTIESYERFTAPESARTAL
jgi:hypothetical protein